MSAYVSNLSVPLLLAKAVAAEEFQVWKLAVNPGNTATLVCEDGLVRSPDARPFTREAVIECPCIRSGAPLSSAVQ